MKFPDHFCALTGSQMKKSNEACYFAGALHIWMKINDILYA